MADVKKTEDGIEFGPDEFFYVPDRESPSTWKLRKTNDSHEMDKVHVGAAAAALGPNPPHGNAVEIPEADIPLVKRNIRAAMRKLGYADDEIPFGEGVVEVEAFKVGNYGDKGNYSEADLEQIAQDYNVNLHEAPVTLDHKAEGPAFGWVESVRRVGANLVLMVRDMADGLRQAIKDGAYKKVSIELYKQFKETGRAYIRAVSFLGAKVPEIKGLSPVLLSEDEEKSVKIEFDEGGELDMAEQTEMEKKIAGLEALVQSGNARFEEERQKRITAEDRAKSVNLQFTEKQRLQIEEAAEKQVNAFCEEQIKLGFISPAQIGTGLPSLMRHLAADNETVLCFGEKEELKATPLEILKAVLTLHKVMLFSEVAGSEKSHQVIGNIAEFSEKANKAGVTLAQYMKAVEAVKNVKDITPELYIEANPEDFQD